MGQQGGLGPLDEHPEDATPLNVAGEMHKIRAQVRQEHGSLPTLDMQIQRRLHQAREKWRVQEAPFTSKVPVVGPLIAAFRTAWNNVSAKWYVRRILQQQNEYNYVVYQVLEELVRQMQPQGQVYDGIRSDLGQLRERLSEMELRLLSVHRASQQPSLPAQSEQGPAVDAGSPTSTAGPGWSYLGFNAAFTALGSVVRETYRQYVSLFKERRNILDAACGQGHFLELLKEAGIEAYGVDHDPEMVEMCRLKQLRVELADVTAHLTSLPAGTLGGLFCGHLLEHLSRGQLQEFLHLALDRLVPGGVIVCETPNTRSLFVLANTFYRDPTHQSPLHPETYQFLFRACGFENVELRYSSIPPGVAPQPLTLPEDASPELQALAAQFNDRLRGIQDQLYGYQNVAIIAVKPQAGSLP